MNEDLFKRVLQVIDSVEGGTTTGIMQLFDEAIEDGTISEEEFHQNEYSILAAADDRIFECVRCGWTQPISEMGEDEDGEFVCLGCQE